MKRVFQLLFVSMVPVVGLAQQSQTPQKFSLEECIQYALDNSINIKNAVIDEQIADARVNETRGIGLPQVDGSVSIQHNQKLPPFFCTVRHCASFRWKG